MPKKPSASSSTSESVGLTLSSQDLRIPQPGTIDPDFELVARLDLCFTHLGVRNAIEWECYAFFDRAGQTPRKRTSPWLVGHLRNPSAGYVLWDLHDIGAQNRRHVAYVRPVVHGASIFKIVQTHENHDEIPNWKECSSVGQSAPQDPLASFYEIQPSEPDLKKKDILKRRYKILSNDRCLRLEVVIKDHLPNGRLIETAQLEDGGPPPVPPSAMEN